MSKRFSAGILVGLVLASLAACTTSNTTSARRPTTTVGPTPTPAPLIWTRRALPAFSPAEYTDPSLELSASDPNVAYLCVISKDSQADTHLHVWRTDDRAARWTEVVNHSVINTSGGSGFERPVRCHVVADLFDLSTAALVYFEQVVRPVPGTGLSEEKYTSSLSVTHDAGKTWQTLSPPTFFVQQAATLGSFEYDVWRLATVREKTFALFSNFYAPQFARYATIAVSTDGMRTWAPAGPPASQLYDLWVNRATGALLVASERAAGGHDYSVDTLWASPDGQAPWRKVKDFTGQSASWLLANLPVASESWQLCYSLNGSPNANATAPAAPGIYCSADSGATWRRAGPLPLTAGVLVLAQDGSLYNIGGHGGCDVLRLRLDVGAWETVGMLPVTDACHSNTTAAYAGEAGHVALWSLPIAGYGTPAVSYPAVYTADYA